VLLACWMNVTEGCGCIPVLQTMPNGCLQPLYRDGLTQPGHDITTWDHFYTETLESETFTQCQLL